MVNKKLTEDLALATQELSAIVEALARKRAAEAVSDSDEDFLSSSSGSSSSGAAKLLLVKAAGPGGQAAPEPGSVTGALARVSGKVRVRREESQLLKTTGGVDEREKTLSTFRSSRMPVDVNRLRRECVSGNSIAELISDHKSLQKEALAQQLDRDYVAVNSREAAKIGLPSQALLKVRQLSAAREVRLKQAREKHQELDKEKAEMRVLSLSREPVARQTVAAYRALPVSVVSSSQAAASPLLNKDADRRWAAVLVAGSFAERLAEAAEALVRKRQRDAAWLRFHLAGKIVWTAVHWRQRARRAKLAIKAWMHAVRCMRMLRRHWRRRRESRSAEIVKTLVMNALNAGKARFAIRRFLHSTRHIQRAWKKYLGMQEAVVRRWNKAFMEQEYKFLNGVFREHREGRPVETKDEALQEAVRRMHGERATRVLSASAADDADHDGSEPSTPRAGEKPAVAAVSIAGLHPGLLAAAAAGAGGPAAARGGRRRAAVIRAADGGASHQSEWAAAQAHRQVETHRLQEATRFAILASEFHNRMRGRADARKQLQQAFSNYAVRVREFYEFLGFFGIEPAKADRSSLAEIKNQYEQTVADLRKAGALASIKDFPDIGGVVANAHRVYGTVLVTDHPQPHPPQLQVQLQPEAKETSHES